MPTKLTGSILFFAFATAMLAASGEYQQTRDGKTTVWNGNPKPGETSSWAGARDKEGYATGFGTITWYTAEGKVYALYYGNMINGKFEGPVNAHIGRQRAHAYFVDGSRETAWARGPAPSKMKVPEELVAKRRKAEAEPPKPRVERAETKKEKEEKRTETAETIRPIEHTAKPEQTHPPPAETEKPPEQTPTSAPVVESTPAQTPEPTQTVSAFSEPPIIAETRETPIARETPRVSTPEPSVEQKPAGPQSTPVEAQPTPGESPTVAERKSGPDGSLNALTGPPSSLRSIPETSPAAKSEPRSRSTSTGTRGVAQLSEDEAISLADTEARARSYDLNDYQRPKADYSAVKDKWTLFYNLKDPKTAGGDLQPFSVTVEDKTKKVEIRRNY